MTVSRSRSSSAVLTIPAFPCRSSCFRSTSSTRGHCLPVEAFFQGVERKIAALRVVHRLDRRRRRPEYDQSPGPQPAIERDLARMVARRVLRFIGVLLLLIQNEETGVFYRRKYRRPRPDDNARPPLADAPPLVKPRADL